MCNGPFLGLHIGDIPSLLGERIWRFLQGMKEQIPSPRRSDVVEKKSNNAVLKLKYLIVWYKVETNNDKGV